MKRTLPLLCDRDRIAAARYAAELLTRRLNSLAISRHLLWMHYADSQGGIRSEHR